MSHTFIINSIDSKIEHFINTTNNYPKYLLLDSKTYIDFYKSHFVDLKGEIPLTLNIDHYKNIEIVLVPIHSTIIEVSGDYVHTNETLLEKALKYLIS